MESKDIVAIEDALFEDIREHLGEEGTNIYIPEIGNGHGILSVKSENNKFFWGIHDCFEDIEWSEIPKLLFILLITQNNK